MDWRSLESCSAWGHWGSDMTERLHFHFSLSRVGEGNGNPLQCSCLENPRDGGAWWAAIYGVAQSWTWLKWLINFTYIDTYSSANNYTSSSNSKIVLVHKDRSSLNNLLLFPFIWLCQVASVISDSVQPHRWQLTRLPCPWDSPGKNTGVGCHCLLQCMKVKSERKVAQLCPTLSDPMDFSLPGSSVHGIFQSRVPEWGAIAFSSFDFSMFINI